MESTSEQEPAVGGITVHMDRPYRRPGVLRVRAHAWYMTPRGMMEKVWEDVLIHAGPLTQQEALVCGLRGLLQELTPPAPDSS